LLPHNPKPHLTAATTKENVADILTNAMQLVGFLVEGLVEVLAIESGPTLQTISFRLPLKIH
jgi:S-DNA-T family DNA segregation ATPase FtsK/SpoIIIE